MIKCLLLGREIEDARCDAKGHKQKSPACRKCLKKTAVSTFEDRVDQVVKGYGGVRRKLLGVAMQHGYNRALLEDHKYQIGALQRTMLRNQEKGEAEYGGKRKKGSQRQAGKTA